MDFFAKAQDALGVSGDTKAEAESASAGGFSIGGVDLKQASDYVHQAAGAVDKAVESDIVKSSGYADQVVQAQQLIHTADEKLQSGKGDAASAGGFSIGGVDLKQATDYVHQAAGAVDKAVENDIVKSSGYADQVVQAQQLIHTADEKLQSVNTPAAKTPAANPPAQKQ